MKTYFLTGGLGLIGYHLAKQLLSTKNNVIIYDAQKHYIPFDKSTWSYYSVYRVNDLNKVSAENAVNLKIIRGDCIDRELLKSSLNKHKPDIIIHLAALSIAGISAENPTEARINIFDNTMVVLDVLKEITFPYERFVYVSSSMVYGNFLRDNAGAIIPAKEEQQCNPIDIYGAMKLSCEHLVKAYHYKFGIPYTIIRPSAVYGHTDCNQRVTEIFLSNALHGKELLLDNKGTHQLDFTYIDDLVEGFILALNSKLSINDTFNLSGGKGWSINQLADVICKLIPGTTIRRIEAVPYRPNRGALNISKANTCFGYSPKYDLEKGMKIYCEQFKKSMKNIS